MQEQQQQQRGSYWLLVRTVTAVMMMLRGRVLVGGGACRPALTCMTGWTAGEGFGRRCVCVWCKGSRVFEDTAEVQYVLWRRAAGRECGCMTGWTAGEGLLLKAVL
jgi:hypothetical protein